MKKFISILLTVFSPLAAVPTGWAIYAGVTEQPAFPMWGPAAFIGAVAVISTSAAAALLVVDILKHNLEAKDQDEQKMNLPTWYGWAILIGCIAAEILLSLLIVVVPGWLAYGVMAFPLMTLAGAFAFALRLALEERVKDRANARIKHERDAAELRAKEEQELALLREKHEQEIAERRALQRSAREAKRTAAESAKVQTNLHAVVALPTASAPQSAATPSKYPRKCDHCDYEFKNSNAVGGHMKKVHPELCKPKSLVVEFFEKAGK